MRVLHLAKTSTGATWALRQMRELVRLGVEVHVALPSGGALVPEYERAGVSVHFVKPDLPVRRPWEFPAQRQELRRLVRASRPDLIHSHFVGTTIAVRWALGRSSRIPRVFQVPGPLHLEHALYRRVEIRSAGPADYWIGSCRWTCDEYVRRGVSPDRVFLSYYGMDTGSFLPRTPGKLRRELGLGSNTKIVGMVAYVYAPKRFLGQTRGLKGHEDLIDALAEIRRHRSDVIGVFVGGPWGRAEEYEKAVRRYGRSRLGDAAIFLGTRTDVADLYADFDVAVHPSHSENVGGACESMLLGVPTVTTNVGGFPDLVLEGETGWLAPPKSPKKLSQRIDEVLRDPQGAQRVALAGQERARERMDLHKNVRCLVDAYEQVVARHRGAGGSGVANVSRSV